MTAIDLNDPIIATLVLMTGASAIFCVLAAIANLVEGWLARRKTAADVWVTRPKAPTPEPEPYVEFTIPTGTYTSTEWKPTPSPNQPTIRLSRPPAVILRRPKNDG